MAVIEHIGKAFSQQAAACRSFGSPFTAHLCDRLPEVLANDPVLGRVLADWPLDPVDSALALRLCGALHRLVRSGRVPVLAALYPPEGRTGTELDLALAHAATQHGPLIVEWLASAPQTNEVARSGVLLGGLLTIAAATGLPLRLMEIGSSAGVNLFPDDYAYDLGSAGRWGSPDAPLVIHCQWRGATPPLAAALHIAGRSGVDLAPIDPSDPAQRERVLAYIWPDQPHRLARTAAALDHAAARRAPVATGDAADWVEARLAEPAEPGVAGVLMHSITWQYLPADRQARIEAAMTDAGSRATEETPLAWLRLEPDSRVDSAAITLTMWPGGEHRSLGRGDYHGRFADWT